MEVFSDVRRESSEVSLGSTGSFGDTMAAVGGGPRSRPMGLSERDGRRNETRRDAATVLQTAGDKGKSGPGPRTGSGVVEVRLLMR